MYTSNVHAGNLGARFAIAKTGRSLRGLHHHEGHRRRPQCCRSRRFSLTDQSIHRSADLPALIPVAVSPSLGAHLCRNPRNAGYQFYNYHEDFRIFGYYQNFHAHTGYTSLTWAF